MSTLRWKARWRLYLWEGDRRSIVFWLMAFLNNLAFGAGMASADALMVSRIGTEPLFYVYLATSLLTFLLAGWVYLLVDRYSRIQIISLHFEIFAAIILTLWWLAGHSSQAWIVFVARILADVFFVLTLLEFWLLASDYFTNLEAKLRFPLLVAASTLGFMFGSLLLQKLAEEVQALNFFLLWGGVLALLPVFLLFLPKANPPLAENPESDSQPNVVGGGEAATVPPSASKLLRLLFLFWLAFTFFSYGVDYVFNTVALESLPDENQLAAFFGEVAFFSLLAVFLFQVFFASKLATMLSVDRSLLVFCLILFFGTAVLAFYPSLAVVAFAEGLLFYFLESRAVTNLEPVANLFPDQLRGRAKVLLDGFAPAVGDLVLLAAAMILTWTIGIEHLSYLLAAGTALFLAFPFLFRKTYLQFLTDCLRIKDPNLVLNAVQALGENDKKPAVIPLLQLLEETPDMILKKNIVLSLGRIRSETALPKVIELFSIPQESLQLAVIEALGFYRSYPSLFALYDVMKSQENVSFQVRMSATLLMTEFVGARMIPLLQEALREEDVRIKANAIESLALLKDSKIIPLIFPYLNHSRRRLRANAAIALRPFRAYRKESEQVIRELFQSEDPLTRFAGIYAIGQLGLREYRPALVELLEHPDPRYRQQVLTALAKMGIHDYLEMFVKTLVGRKEDYVLEGMRSLSRFPPHVRWMVFEMISKSDPASQQRVIARIDETPFDFSQERALLTTRRKSDTGTRF